MGQAVTVKGDPEASVRMKSQTTFDEMLDQRPDAGECRRK